MKYCVLYAVRCATLTKENIRRELNKNRTQNCKGELEHCITFFAFYCPAHGEAVQMNNWCFTQSRRKSNKVKLNTFFAGHYRVQFPVPVPESWKQNKKQITVVRPSFMSSFFFSFFVTQTKMNIWQFVICSSSSLAHRFFQFFLPRGSRCWWTIFSNVKYTTTAMYLVWMHRIPFLRQSKQHENPHNFCFYPFN